MHYQGVQTLQPQPQPVPSGTFRAPSCARTTLPCPLVLTLTVATASLATGRPTGRLKHSRLRPAAGAAAEAGVAGAASAAVSWSHAMPM
jgi:hypothetical protein